MKKFYAYLLAAVALVGFAACSTDDTTESTTPDISAKRYISANIGNDATRVSFGEETEEGKLPILWSSTDYIYGQLVYPSATTEGYSDIKEFTCTIADGAGTKSATFEFQGYSEGILTAYWLIPEGIYITAGKPYNRSLKWNEEKQAVVVTSSIDTWDVLGDANNINDQHIAHAYVATEEELLNSGIQVNNLACYLKFQVEKECSEIVFTSNNQFHGLMEYTVNGNEVLEVTGCYTNDEDKAESSTLTLTPNEGGKFDPANVYYMTIIPGDHQFTVNIDGHLSKAASKAMTLKANTIYNLGTLPAPVIKHKVYVLAKDVNWSSVNMVVNSTTTNLTTKETIGSYSYFVGEVVEGSYKFNFNNGTTSSNFVIEGSEAIEVNEDIYLRLTPRGLIQIDPNDETTFGYTIYVFDQKSKNVKPNLYVWDDENAFKNMFGGSYGSWPGVAFTYDCYYKPANLQNWKHYYWHEIPSVLYPSSAPFKFIVNKTGQTADLVIKGVSSDLYIGYWYDSASSNGFWANGSSPYTTPMTN